MSASDDRPCVVVLLSGAGTTTAPLLAAADDAGYGVRIGAVGSDRRSAPGLGLADELGLPTFVVTPADHPDRRAWSARLAQVVADHNPDLVLCAGLMRILDPVFIERFAPRVVNSHPSLLPAFPGARAVSAAVDYGVRITGATLHVVDTGVDTGPIIAQVPVEVRDDDDVPSLHERIKNAERNMLLEWIPRLAAADISIDGRRVTLK